jgi:penicillin-binding protein 1A
MRLALREQPATPFRVPRAIELIPINANSGKRSIFGDEGVILEAFKPGDEPPENTKVIGQNVAAAVSPGQGKILVAPEAPVQKPPEQGGLTEGGGGLY